MKTIFISIYDGDTEKNILRSDVFEYLKEAGHKIILLIRAVKRVSYYRENFEDSQVRVEPLPPARSQFEVIYNYIDRNILPTNSVYLRRWDGYLDHKKLHVYLVGRILGVLGRLRIWRHFLRWFYHVIPDDYASDIFRKHNPDLLFAPNMFSAEDCRLLKYAKKHSIKTIATVKSWDVLTTKAFTRVIADKICVFNEYNRIEAMDLGDYKERQIIVTGFPQFDVYTKKEIYLSREAFFNKIGADPNKKLILFAVPGDWKNPYTHEVMIGINQAIEAGEIKEPVQVLARFHPKYPATGETLKNLNHFIMDRPGTYFDKGSEKSLDTSLAKTLAWTFTDKDIIHLANSIYHSDVTINTESTMTLDAAALDKPVVLVGYDGFHKLDYYRSIVRNYDREHFQYVLKTGGARLAKNSKEMAKYINLYLENSELDKGKREELRNKLIYKIDGQSSRRVAEAVLSLLF